MSSNKGKSSKPAKGSKPQQVDVDNLLSMPAIKRLAKLVVPTEIEPAGKTKDGKTGHVAKLHHRFGKNVEDSIRAYGLAIMKDAVKFISTITSHANRKTVSGEDVEYYLKSKGVKHYGILDEVMIVKSENDLADYLKKGSGKHQIVVTSSVGFNRLVKSILATYGDFKMSSEARNTLHVFFENQVSNLIMKAAMVVSYANKLTIDPEAIKIATSICQ